MSALVLSTTVAWAQESEPAAQPSQDPQTLVEVEGAAAADVGTATDAFVGMTAGEIEGLDIVNSADETIGSVSTVAENENGAIFLVVEIDEDVSPLPAGEHAMPLTAFDYNAEDEVLRLRDDAMAADAAYTVLESDAVIEQVDVSAYGQPLDEQAAVEPADDTLEATDQAAMETEEPLDGQDQAATATEEPMTGQDQAATEAEEPLDGQDQAATETEPLEGQDQAATETEEPMTGQDQAATATEEPLDGQDQAATEIGEEAAAQVEPSAGAEQGAPTTEEAVTMTDEGTVATDDAAEEMAAGNARQILEEQGVAAVEGLDILNPELEDIGTVEYVAQDASGKLYLIVSLDDGILGMGDSERVVALDAFDYLPEEESFVLLDVSEATLEAMAEWDTDNTQYTVIEEDLDWSAYN